MKAASYPYNQDFLDSIHTMIPDVDFGNWILKETNLLFVINEDCDIYTTTPILFQERRNRVLSRKNDFFWILIVSNQFELENFLSQKHLLGFWDVFCVINNEKNALDHRALYELSQSVRKIGSYAS